MERKRRPGQAQEKVPVCTLTFCLASPSVKPVKNTESVDKQLSYARKLAATLLKESIRIAGPIETLEDLIKRARSVMSSGTDQGILTIAVADVFAHHWESRAN